MPSSIQIAFYSDSGRNGPAILLSEEKNKKVEKVLRSQLFFTPLTQLVFFPAYPDCIFTKLGAEDFLNCQNCGKCFNINFPEDMLKPPSYSLPGTPKVLCMFSP